MLQHRVRRATSPRPSTARSSIGFPRRVAKTTSRWSFCASTSRLGSAVTAYDVIVVGAGSAGGVDAACGGDGLHGKGGPIPRWELPFDELRPLDRALRTALGDRGYPVCDDYHAVDATGVSRAALTLRDGRRVSTNDAYLEPARARANLEVRGDVLVDRVLLDGRHATGVRTATGEEIAGRDVIVSAGAIHSPAILLRSGVGVDDGLPVGANLKDHAATAGFEIALTPAGRMASPDAPVFGSLLRYSSGMADAGPNDMQMVWFRTVGPTEDALAGGRLIGAVMRVFSHGEVRLRSDDALVDPVVEFRMLSDDR